MLASLLGRRSPLSKEKKENTKRPRNDQDRHPGPTIHRQNGKVSVVALISPPNGSYLAMRNKKRDANEIEAFIIF
jgi:hypothetical protein